MGEDRMSMEIRETMEEAAEREALEKTLLGQTTPDKERGLVQATVNTRHPEAYTLVDNRSGQRWSLTPEGSWTLAEEPEYEYAIQHKWRGGLVTGLDKRIIDLLDEAADRADYTVLRRPKPQKWEEVK